MNRSILPPKTLAAVVLAFAVAMFVPGSAFAQHGGGHGGGGHMGGGGFGGHSGGFGGSHAGGGSRSSGSSHSGRNTRSTPVTTSTPPQSGHPVSTGTSASATGTATDNVPAREAGAVVHTPTFGPSGSGEAAHSTAFELRSEPPAARNSVIGFPSAESRIGTTSGAEFRPSSGKLSFSGQGRAIWQNAPASHATNTSPESQRVLFGHAQGSTVVHRPVPPHRVFGPPVRGPIYYYYPAFGFYPFGFFGSGFCDPFWGFDPSFGCGAFGFGYGYGFGGFGYGYPGYFGGYSSASDNSYSVGADTGTGPRVYSNDDADGDPGAFSAAPSLQQGTAGDAGASAGAPAAAAAPPSPETVIYMKDGTNFAVMSYWLDAGQLHYITNYGGENRLDMGQLDLQRTVDENARTGVDFTLKPAAPPQQASAPSPQQ